MISSERIFFEKGNDFLFGGFQIFPVETLRMLMQNFLRKRSSPALV
jgi:hypothetical protein